LTVKYKAELASQDYKREVELLNRFLAKFEDEYKPLLSRLQQSEESRINFLKYNFEKFIKHLNGIGKKIVDKSSEM
jgi:glutathione peroxidase-family protein